MFAIASALGKPRTDGTLDPEMDNAEAESRYVAGLKRWLPDIKDKEIEEKLRLFRDARILKKQGGGRSA